MTALVIARNTLGKSLRNRVLLVFVLLAVISLMMALMLSYLSTREMITHFKATQLVIILIFGALISVTTAIFLVPQEIENRTIYSILSKPVQRWEFFLGKFLGGAMTVGVTLGLMVIVLMIMVFAMNARPAGGMIEEAAAQAGPINFKEWFRVGGREVMTVLRGGLVIYFELVLLTAIATTFSTVLTPTVNFCLTMFIFIVGCFQDVLGAFMRRGDLQVTKWLANAFYYIIPHFKDFNIMGSIVHSHVPMQISHAAYAVQVSLYGILYALMILLVGVLIFDRKEV